MEDAASLALLPVVWMQRLRGCGVAVVCSQAFGLQEHGLAAAGSCCITVRIMHATQLGRPRYQCDSVRVGVVEYLACCPDPGTICCLFRVGVVQLLKMVHSLLLAWHQPEDRPLPGHGPMALMAAQHVVV
jgi:hypothetical protein